MGDAHVFPKHSIDDAKKAASSMAKLHRPQHPSMGHPIAFGFGLGIGLGLGLGLGLALPPPRPLPTTRILGMSMVQ